MRKGFRELRIAVAILALLVLLTTIFVRSHYTLVTTSVVFIRVCDRPGCYTPEPYDVTPYRRDWANSNLQKTDYGEEYGEDIPKKKLEEVTSEIFVELNTTDVEDQAVTSSEQGEHTIAQLDEDVKFGTHFLYTKELEPLANHPNRLQRMLYEFGISLNTTFYSRKDLQRSIGAKCSALRHCSLKTSTNFFFRGGHWRQRLAHTNEEVGFVNVDGKVNTVEGITMFNPHDCWTYDFSGKEPWLTSDKETEEFDRLGMVVEREGSNSKLSRAVDHFAPILSVLKANVPVSLAEEDNIIERISNLIESKKKTGSKVVLTLAFDWRPVFEKEVELIESMWRIGIQLPVASLRLVWLTSPFTSVQESTAAIQLNERMRLIIKNAPSLNDPSHIITPLFPQLQGKKTNSGIRPAQPGKNQDAAFPIEMSAADLEVDLPEYVLIDARLPKAVSRTDQSIQSNFLDRFAAFSVTSDDLLTNVAFPIHPDRKILVVCDTGVNSRKVAESFRKRGYGFATSLHGGIMDLMKGANSEEGGFSLPLFQNVSHLPRQFVRRITLTGLDTFVPSITAPPNIKKPDTHHTLAFFIANMLLNHMFQREIQLSALLPQRKHVCENYAKCSTCFPNHSKVPSERISRALFELFFAQWGVPTIISLPENEKIWSGTWLSLLDKQTKLNSRQPKNADTGLEKFLLESDIISVMPDGTRFEVFHQNRTRKQGISRIFPTSTKASRVLSDQMSFNSPRWHEVFGLQKPLLSIALSSALSPLREDHRNDGNFIYQGLGKTKWHFYPFEVMQWLYVKQSGSLKLSGIPNPGAYNKDMSEKYPKFKLAILKSIDLELAAGEVLFNPERFFYGAKSRTDSLLVSFWIRNVPLNGKNVGRNRR